MLAAVRREINALAAGAPGLKASPEAELALALAAEVESDAPLRDRVPAVRALEDALATLREMGQAQATDRLDEIAARREKRRAS